MMKGYFHNFRISGRSGGFSLVEVLIGMAVSLFLLSVLITVFISNKQSFRMQEGANFMQENGRFAMAFVGHSLRMADHWGGVEVSDMEKKTVSITGLGSCNQSWITDLEVALQGYEGAAAVGSVSQLPGSCIAASDYEPNTDMVVVRRADLGTVLNNEVFVRTAVGLVGVLGQAPASGDPPNLGLGDEDGTANYPYRAELWFIRPCSVHTGGSSATACDAGDDDGTPIPTLSRLYLDGNTLVLQPLVEGIENMQLEYGRDTDEDGNVDRFDTASTLNDLSSAAQREAAWAEVVSVRVALVSRTPQADVALEEHTEDNLILVGDQGPGTGYDVADDDRKYLRRQYTQTFQIRNRTRS